MEIATSQVDVENESPPTKERDNGREEDPLIEHTHVNKRPHLLRNTAGGQVGIPGVFVEDEQKHIQAVNGSARQEKPVSPRPPNDQTEPHAQKQRRKEQIVAQSNAAASHGPEYRDI